MFSKSYINEIWKPVRGYEGLYEVSNFGRVKSLSNSKTRKEKILKKNKVGPTGNYVRVQLCNGGKLKPVLIHHLVWEAFNGPIPEGYEINHLDENGLNNRLDNLSLVTHIENCNWGSRNKRIGANKRKTVLQFTNGGEFVAKYPSAKEAERQTGINDGNISQCCIGKRKSAGIRGGVKFVWRYEEDMIF